MLRDLMSEKNEKKKTEAPSGEEYRLLKMFLSDMKKVTVDPDDHMELDLGLDSLDFVELAVFIESAFNVAVSPGDFALHSVVSEMASFIVEHKKRQSPALNSSGFLSPFLSTEF